MTNTEIKIRLEKILVRNEQRKANKLIPADILDIKDIIKQLSICDVMSSCVDKETLIEDLDDKRIVGVTLDENMWHYCRKETAEHLLDKYEIKTK